MADVMAAFLQGHNAGQAEQEHAQRLEENKLRTMVLKHEIDRLKLDDQIRGRELMLHNLQLLHGQPAADIPSDDVTSQQPNLPSKSAAGAMTGLPDVVSSLLRAKFGASESAGPGTLPAPDAQATAPGTNPVTTRVARSVTIPGVPGLGVPDVQMRPRSMEELIQAQIAEKMAEPYTLNPGAERQIGGRTIGRGGPAFHSVGAGGLAATNPDGTTTMVAPGRPPTPQRPLVVNGQVLDPNDPTKVLKVVPPQKRPGSDPTFNQDFRQYTSEVAQAQRKHNEAFKLWQKASDNAINGVDTTTGKPIGEAPDYTPPTFDEWRADHGTSAKTPASTVTQPTDPLQAADPATGAIYVFPSKDKADGYRKAKGIK